jgi:hypothetical protein
MPRYPGLPIRILPVTTHRFAMKTPALKNAGSLWMVGECVYTNKLFPDAGSAMKFRGNRKK